MEYPQTNITFYMFWGLYTREHFSKLLYGFTETVRNLPLTDEKSPTIF